MNAAAAAVAEFTGNLRVLESVISVVNVVVAVAAFVAVVAECWEGAAAATIVKAGVGGEVERRGRMLRS